MLHRELEQLSTGHPMNDALKQLTTTLEEMRATSHCGCVMFGVLNLLCDALMSLSVLWSSMGPDSVGFSSSSNVVPPTDVTEALQSLLQTLKTTEENAQVMLEEIYSVGSFFLQDCLLI